MRSALIRAGLVSVALWACEASVSDEERDSGGFDAAAVDANASDGGRLGMGDGAASDAAQVDGSVPSVDAARADSGAAAACDGGICPLVCEWPAGYEGNDCCWRLTSDPSTCSDGLACCSMGSADHRSPATWPGDWSAYEDEVLVRVNAYRAAGYDCAGSWGYHPPVGPLRMNDALRAAARRHSIDQSIGNFVGHVGSDGSFPMTRALEEGYTGTPSLENAGGGYGPGHLSFAMIANATPEIIVDNWMASPGHCKTIMKERASDSAASPLIDEVGIGYTNMLREQDDLMVSHRRWTLVIGASTP